MKNFKIYIAVFALAIFMGIPIGKASAAPNLTCWGSSCNNLDPASSGCSAITAAYDRDSSLSGTVRADLRWSSGCYSNWTRTTNEYPGVVRHLKAYLTSEYPYYNRVVPEESSLYVQIWTNMYSGYYYNCSQGKQGFVDSSIFDAITSADVCG